MNISIEIDKRNGGLYIDQKPDAFRICIFFIAITFRSFDYEQTIYDYVKTTRERCICAAVKDQFGNIYRGHRHGDCMTAIRQRGKHIDHKEDSQGFITSRNRYVNRREGLRLQKEAGIPSVSEDGYGIVLFSEDLY